MQEAEDALPPVACTTAELAPSRLPQCGAAAAGVAAAVFADAAITTDDLHNARRGVGIAEDPLVADVAERVRLHLSANDSYVRRRFTAEVACGCMYTVQLTDGD